jgi:hypothetical protein
MIYSSLLCSTECPGAWVDCWNDFEKVDWFKELGKGFNTNVKCCFVIKCCPLSHKCLLDIVLLKLLSMFKLVAIWSAVSVEADCLKNALITAVLNNDVGKNVFWPPPPPSISSRCLQHCPKDEGQHDLESLTVFNRILILFVRINFGCNMILISFTQYCQHCNCGGIC